MGNKCKRFLMVLLATVLLISLISANVFAADTENTALECYTYGDVNCDGTVDQKDAIYLLYHAALGGDQYPLKGRGGDMDGDGDIDKDDAIHLLFHTFQAFAKDYPLPEREVHVYGEPVWSWNVKDAETKIMEATFTVKCGCDELDTQTVEIAMDAEASKAATCTVAGQEVYRAKVTFNGKEYAGEKIVVLPATGHDVTPTCAGEAECQNGCGHKVAALAHTWNLLAEEAATCSVAGGKAYQCECGAEKTEVIPATGNHAYGEETTVVVEGTSCTYQDVKICGTCGHEVNSDAYEKHSYTTVTKFAAATCSAAGERVYQCDSCDSTKTETLAQDSSVHNWDNGVTMDDGNTLYTCSACGATKVVVVVKSEDVVNKESLKGKELALDEGTSIALDDDVVDQLDDQIQITVTDVTGQVDLSNEQLEAIGDNTIYDFNIKNSAGETVVFDGEVTVTLPYELAEGENIDSIAVWYIDENGEAQSIQATYANGSITFTTSHFSYYTVTRLTPAERCDLYGHKYGMEWITAPTCGDAGYTQQVCQRCGDVKRYNEIAALGHKYVDTANAASATCDKVGKFSQQCQHCGDVVEYDIPAMGHAYELYSNENAAPTCSAPGKEVYQCANCDAGYEVVIAQVPHEFEEVIQSVTCEAKGYYKNVCSICQYEEVLEEMAALGHSYADAKHADATKHPVWNWSLDAEGDLNGNVTVTVYCANGTCTDSKELTAVVSEMDNTGCDGGSIIYTATASYNKQTFQDRYVRQFEGEGHKLGAWEHDASKHYRQCEVCLEQCETGTHEWDNGTETKKATCSAGGEIVYKCICGRETKEVLPATGEHDLKNGVCSVCGFESTNCKHWTNREIIIDLEEEGYCGGTVILSTCDCGEYTDISTFEYVCGTTEGEITKTNEDGFEYTVYQQTCQKCGLVVENWDYFQTDNDPCTQSWIWGYAISFNGETYSHENRSENQHPLLRSETNDCVDLAEYGLCGYVMAKYSCPCGANTGEDVDHGAQQKCYWEYDPYDPTPYASVYHCSGCGATRISRFIEEWDKENCDFVFGTHEDFYMNGELVHSSSRMTPSKQHDTYIADYVLAGETCEDGVYYISKCRYCDYTDKSYEYWHLRINGTVIDMSDYGVCFDRVYTDNCVCGLQLRNGWIEGERICVWEEIETNADRSKVTYHCAECGSTMVQSVTMKPLYDGCRYVQTMKYTITDKDGKHVVTYYSDNVTTEHEYETTYTLRGENCEEGVDWVRACVRCGESYSGTDYYHIRHAVKTVDLTALNCCFTSAGYYECLCGQMNGMGYNSENGEHCDWYWIDSVENGYIEKCINCGMIKEEVAVTEEGAAACEVYIKRSVTFTNGDETRTLTYQGTEANHDYIVQTTLLGDDCTDGYTLQMVCQRCGYSEDHGTQYEHWTYVVAREIYSDARLCGDIVVEEVSCACGWDSWINVNEECNSFYGYYSDELGAHVEECAECGVCHYNVLLDYAPGSTDCETFIEREYVYFIEDTELFRFTRTEINTRHNWQYEFNLYGTDCDDGYDYTAVCAVCGETREATSCWGHNGYSSWSKLIDAEGICSPYYTVNTICACGYRNESDWYYECNFDWRYDEELGCEIGECAKCGLVRDQKTQIAQKEDGCVFARTTIDTFYLNGEELGVSTSVGNETHHSWTYDWNLLGDTCDDGYTFTRTCKYCGTTENYDEVRYGCEWWMMDYNLVYGGEGICGAVWQLSDGCACGNLSSTWTNQDCSFQGGHWDEDLDANVYQCRNCDVVRVEKDGQESEPDENCIVTRKYEITLKLGDTVLTTYEYNNRWTSHSYTYEFTLLGEDCDDGYYETGICKRCGFSHTWEDIHYGHETYTMERYYLEEYGLCGGELYVYSCPCGQSKGASYSTECNSSYTGNTDPETGADEYYCGACGSYTWRLHQSEYNREECCVEGRMIFKIVRDGETVLNVEEDIAQIEHTYIVRELALYDDSGCEGGYIGTNVCYYCGDTQKFENSGHGNHLVDYVELAKNGSCGGYLWKYLCACGLYQSYNHELDCNWGWDETWSETDPNGVEHYFGEGGCDDCGLRISRDECIILDEGSCEGMYYDYLTFTLGNGNEVKLANVHRTTSHKWGEVTYALAEGSETCMDGLRVTQVCEREGCEEVNTWTTYPDGHYNMNATDSIDLEQYGSICGEALVHYTCPCGAGEHWSFDNENHCDLDQKGTDMNWLDAVIKAEIDPAGVLIDDVQETTEGYVYSYSDAYIFTCAVTNPDACGLKVQMAEYWVKVGCEVKEYQTWQLGYDADTGTCQYEFTVATGDKHAYHDYKYSNPTETLDDGTVVNVELYLCPDCGSYYQWKQYYLNGDHIKTLNEWVNTLDNGETKRRTELYEYGKEQTYEHNGSTGSFRYISREYDTTIYADGSEYWAEWVYTYNFEDSCLRTCNYQNSNGEKSTYTDNCHESYWNCETIEDSTCTQHGSQREWWTCYVCSKITSDYTYAINPTAHYWNRDDEKQTFVCSVCQLENINGASGCVVMEDLTEDGGENYVIGYWNRDNVKFTVYVSVILDELGADEDREFVLSGIQIHDHTKEQDGFVGKSFSKAAAIAAAEITMADLGYEGSYAIRISFVPDYDEYDLDYAITFDSINAA